MSSAVEIKDRRSASPVPDFEGRGYFRLFVGEIISANSSLGTFMMARTGESPMMDELEQRIFIRFLTGKLKEYWRELAAHRIFAETLRANGYQDVDKILAAARAYPSLPEEMDRHFAWLDKLIPPLESEIQEKALLEYLQKWQPDGEPN